MLIEITEPSSFCPPPQPAPTYHNPSRPGSVSLRTILGLIWETVFASSQAGPLLITGWLLLVGTICTLSSRESLKNRGPLFSPLFSKTKMDVSWSCLAVLVLVLNVPRPRKTISLGNQGPSDTDSNITLCVCETYMCVCMCMTLVYKKESYQKHDYNGKLTYFLSSLTDHLGKRKNFK